MAQEGPRPARAGWPLGALALLLAAVAVVALAVGLEGLVTWPGWVKAEGRAEGTGIAVGLRADSNDPERPTVLPAGTEARLATMPDVLAVVTRRRDVHAEIDCGSEKHDVLVGDLSPEPPPVGRPLLAAGSYPEAPDEALIGYHLARRCGIELGADVLLRPAGGGDDAPPPWPGRVVGLVGNYPWDILIPAASYDGIAGERLDRSVVLQVPETVSRSRVRDGVLTLLPEVPARALITRDERQDVDQLAGHWRLRAAAVALGGLLAAAVAAAGAYAAAGAARGGAVLALGLGLGLALGAWLPATPTAFQVPYLLGGERLWSLLGSAGVLVVGYTLALLPATGRRMRLRGLLRWAARRRAALLVLSVSLLAGAVWLFVHGFVADDLTARTLMLQGVAAAAALLIVGAPLLWLVTPAGRLVLSQAWERLTEGTPGEPDAGRPAALLAAAGGVVLLVGTVALLAASVLAGGDDPEGYVFLAEVAGGLAAVHAYAAFGLQPGALGPYRAMLGLAALWVLPGLTAPLAGPLLVLLALPRARAYYRGSVAPAAGGAAAAGPAEAGAGASPESAPAVAPDALALVGGSPLFAELPTGAHRYLAAVATAAEFPAGTVVLREGDRGQDLYGLADGRLAVEGVGLGGEVLPLAELEPGTWFGEMALLTGAPRSATVRAITPVRVLCVPAGAVREALARNAAFAASLRQRVDYLDQVGFLQRFSPFANLPRATIVAAAERFQRRTYAAGAVLVAAGQPGAAWYLVKQGRAEARWPDGRTLRLGPGDGFGEEALLRDPLSGYTVTASTDLEVLELAREEFRTVVAAHGALRRFFGELLRARYAGAPEQALGLPDPVATLMPRLSSRGRGRAWRVLAAGLVALAGLSFLSAQTEHGLAITATILLGSFLAPVVYLGYLRERDLLRTFSWRRLFVIGTITLLVAVPVAVLAEEWLKAGSMDFGPALLTAVIEETAKLFGVVWLLWRRRYRFELDGIVFGVAAGLWFAGIEDIVYAYGALAQADSPESAVSSMLGVVWLRLVTSFFGHGVWTGLICAAIWRGKGGGAPRWDWEVVRAFAVAVLLHTLWDWAPEVFILPVSLVGTLLLRERIQRASESEQQTLATLGLARPGEGVTAEGLAERGGWPCPRCGAVAVPGTLYCARCGAALTAPAAELDALGGADGPGGLP